MSIVEYAYKNRDELRLWVPKREALQRLVYLSASRSRLLTAQKMLKTPLNKSMGLVGKAIAKLTG